LVEKSTLLLGIAGIAAIIFAVVIVAMVQNSYPQSSFSKIISVGPVWDTDAWQCTSSSNFLVHGVLRGFADAQFAIDVSNIGSQSLYTYSYYGQTESFTVGAEANQSITITRTGTVSGFLTLQTNTDATANCVPI
jgi:hypothetical protein